MEQSQTTRRVGDTPEEQWEIIRSQLPPATHQPKDCPHPEFTSFVAINRFEDSGLFSAEIRLCCKACHEPMRFKGMAAGINWITPTVSIDGLVAYLPCEPEIEKQLMEKATYVMPDIPRRH